MQFSPVPLNHLQNMLKELFVKGPYTIGIFRKSANARVCKEFRAKLESDPNTDVSEVPVIVIASVFKVSTPFRPNRWKKNYFQLIITRNKKTVFHPKNCCGNQSKRE